jgi:hypothetical protein
MSPKLQSLKECSYEKEKKSYCLFFGDWADQMPRMKAESNPLTKAFSFPLAAQAIARIPFL